MGLLSFLCLLEAARLLADAQNWGGGGGSLGGAQRTRQTPAYGRKSVCLQMIPHRAYRDGPAPFEKGRTTSESTTK